MKRLIYIIIITVLFACKDEAIGIQNTCGVDNPVEDLAWLKQLIQVEEEFTPTYYTIHQGIYNDKTIFILDSCCPQCNVAPQTFSCEGNLIPFESISSEKITEKRLIAKGKDVTCTF